MAEGFSTALSRLDPAEPHSFCHRFCRDFQVIEYGTPLNASPVRTALLWSTPLAFYLLPAALVIFSWLRRDRRYTLLRALGIGLLSIGILNFPFILWLTHLWAVYYQPMGS
jgi:hypothetical protein